MSTKYKIIRFKFNGRPRTLQTGLSLEEAQAHCKNPESSSTTCSSAKARKVRANGPWFEGYDSE